MEHYALRLRAYPNQDQRSQLDQDFGNCRYVYNWALSIKVKEYEDWKQKDKPSGNKWLTYKELSKQLTDLRDNTDWLKKTAGNSLQQSLRHMFVAYNRWFSRDSEYPCFKSKFKARKSVHYSNAQVLDHQIQHWTDHRFGYIRIPNCGQMKVRFHQNVPEEGRLLRTSIHRDGTSYYVAMLFEVPDGYNQRTPLAKTFKQCGIDLGVVRPLTVSYRTASGEEKIKVLGEKERQKLVRLEIRRKRYQRSFARKKVAYDKRKTTALIVTDKNLQKAKDKVGKAFEQEKNYRNNFAQVVSKQLAERFETLKFEDLKIKSMTKSAKGTVDQPGTKVAAKSGLNREMLRLGLGNVVELTVKKAELYGHQVKFVDPKYTSQRCNSCGHIEKANRESQSVFNCCNCGLRTNADHNAARNIRCRKPLAA